MFKKKIIIFSEYSKKIGHGHLIRSTRIFDILKKILKSKIHKFSIDGQYLMKNGMQQGKLLGKVLKQIEKEWIKNNFKITSDKIQEIIKSHSN